MNMLKYFEGARPGQKRKPIVDINESKKEKCKKYEATRPERRFQESWKEGRTWLVFESDMMKCDTCLKYYGVEGNTGNGNLRGQNTFITGCKNMKISALFDHENSKGHQLASERFKVKETPHSEVVNSSAGRSLLRLKESERNRLCLLFRNAHAVAKNNRPLSDYVWLCNVDKAKGLDLGETYINQKAALIFLSYIAGAEREKTVEMVKKANFFSFILDGSTDISGDEQEAIYLRVSDCGKVHEKFLVIGSPKSTCSKDLFNYCMESFENAGIDTGKLVGMGSDGAANMVGRKSGLATLLRDNVSPELINIHCIAHRLELAFRDELRQSKHYQKLMTLLIGLHYFYIKQYKNKSGLQASIASLNIKGVLPPKVTGTRWLPHLSRGIDSLFKTFKAYESHLSSISRTNAKADGLLRLLLDKSLMCFAIFLQEVLDPLMRLSLKLQRPNITLADSVFWIETTVELLADLKSRNGQSVTELLNTGCLQDIKLRGASPTLSYRDMTIDGLIEAIQKRFDLLKDNMSVLQATKILNFKSWPNSDSDEFLDYGCEEVRQVSQHFSQTLEKVIPDFKMSEAVSEWKVLKKVLSKKYGKSLSNMNWSDVYDEDFSTIFMICDLLLSLPPTSVSCETTFSQMKLIKTSRRTKLNSCTLNDLLTVKLECDDISSFQPEKSIDIWLTTSSRPRQLLYNRKSMTISEPIDIHIEDNTVEENISSMNILYQSQEESDNNEYDDEYRSEADNTKQLLNYDE